MKILLVGGGGREHALAWALSQSPSVSDLVIAPGNPGMAGMGRCVPVDVTDVDGLVALAAAEQVDLTVVGPEAPLAAGLADRLRAAGHPVFGPDQAGARVEASKAFAKALMQHAHVPTADYVACETVDEALAALERFQPPFVIKQDGLAAGKGVTVTEERTVAEAAIRAANGPVVLESFLRGREISLLALCDGQRAIPLVAAQDFKRAGEGDVGPNTGGMGAYSPVPGVDAAVIAQAQAQILDPMMAAFRDHGIDYRGVLYAGLMQDTDGSLSVVEFNARFGDPETQVVLPLLDEDLAEWLMAAAQGRLPDGPGPRVFPRRAAVTVVLASAGYPSAVQTGQPITVPDTLPPNTVLFHAGTRRNASGDLETAGGRVMNATGFGATLAEARAAAYALAEQVQFSGKTLRRDIAEQAAQQLPV